MPEPKDELDDVFENMDTPDPTPARDVEVKRTIVQALGDVEVSEEDGRLISQAQGYILHLEKAGKTLRDLNELLDRSGAPREDGGGALDVAERVALLLASTRPAPPVDTTALEEEIERLVPVFKTARALRDLGYDGPFNGEWTAPLFNAIAEAERKGQR